MKATKILSFILASGIVSCAIPSSAALALEGDKYLGVEGGFSWTQLNDSGAARNAINGIIESQTRLDISSSRDSTNFSGRVYAGYMLADYFGVEFGYAKYGTSKSVTTLRRYNSDFTINAENSISAFDLLGVYRIPVKPGISINAKAGMAYVISRYEVSTEFERSGKEKVGSQNNKNIRPKFGIGADFSVADDISIGASYEITLGKGQPYTIDGKGQDAIATGNGNYSPLIQMLSLGVRYEF